MLGTRKREDAVLRTVSMYSFMDGLPEKVKEKIDEFSEKHAHNYYNGRKAVSFFAKRLGEDYIVSFMRDNADNPYALEMFDSIAHSCMKSMDESTIYENQLVDRKLSRMLSAMSNLRGIPEKQYQLLRMFANHEAAGNIGARGEATR